MNAWAFFWNTLENYNFFFTVCKTNIMLWHCDKDAIKINIVLFLKPDCCVVCMFIMLNNAITEAALWQEDPPPLWTLNSAGQIFARSQTPFFNHSKSEVAVVLVETLISACKMSNNYRLLVKNAKQVVLICNNGEKYLTKDGMQNLCVVENGSVVIGRYVFENCLN